MVSSLIPMAGELENIRTWLPAVAVKKTLLKVKGWLLVVELVARTVESSKTLPVASPPKKLP